MSDATGRRRSADAATLRTLAEARARTREMSDDLLGHLPDVGDLATQRLLDTWVEQAADTLRALSEAAEERLLELGRGEAAASTPPTDAPRAASARSASGDADGGAR
jgi:hypothetical protein